MKRTVVILGVLALSLFGAGAALGHTITSVDTTLACNGDWTVVVHFENFSDGHRIILTVNGYTYPPIIPSADSTPQTGTATAHGTDALNIVGTVSTPDDPQYADLTFSKGPLDCPTPTQHSAPSPTPSHHLTPTPKPDATPPPTSTDSRPPVSTAAFGWLAWFSLTVAFSLTVYAVWRIADKFGER